VRKAVVQLQGNSFGTKWSAGWDPNSGPSLICDQRDHWGGQ